MSVEFQCPIHHEPLDQSDPKQWIGIGHGEKYPLVDGIPILLPDRAERQRVAETDWSAPVTTGQAIDFYNDARFENIYSREHDQERRESIQGWLARLTATG